MKAIDLASPPLDRRVPGLTLTDGHRGVYERGGTKLRVTVEGSDCVGLRCGVPVPPPAAEALAAASALPGNLRFARRGDGVDLVADTLLDGVAHLPALFEEVALAAQQLVGDGCRDAGEAQEMPEMSTERVDEAVSGLGWPEDAVVRDDDAQCWELRPRLQFPRRTAALPVRLTRERGGLLLRRTLLRARPDEADAPAGLALAELALQLNGCIRLARLAFCGRALVAEARLHADLVTPAWLAEAARAVAAASGHCQAPLTLLTTQHRVAEVFLAASAVPATAIEV